MRPARLELEGFGAFRNHTVVDFADLDSFALVGATGSGKSTIIDGITFALYGSVARYDDNKLVEPVISQTSTQARVRLDFELGGHVYTAVRVVRRTASAATTREARLERGGDVLAADARGMTRAVEALLGLDADQFNRTIVLPQGEFAAFLHDTPANRQRTLRQLLGFELYATIGQAARQRAAAARSQIDALQPDVDEGDAELTDERRAAIASAIERLGEVRDRFAVGVASFGELTASIERLTTRLDELDHQLGLLATIGMPDDVAAVERRVTEATDRRDVAVGRLNIERQRRRANATAAVESGPDLEMCRQQLAQRRTAADLDAEHDRLAAELLTAHREAALAATAADAITARQQKLDTEVDQARELERQARAAADTGPDAAKATAELRLHERRASTAAALAELEAVAGAANSDLEPVAADADDAAAAEDAARQRFELVKDRVGVAAYLHLLTVGEPCPLCQHDVHELPVHHLDEELEEASERLESAVLLRQETDRRRLAAIDRVRTATADATAQARALADVDNELAGVPTPETLRALVTEAERLRAAVAAAAAETDRVTTAATGHCDDPDHVVALKAASAASDRLNALMAVADHLAPRLAAAHAAIADLPTEPELTASITDAERRRDEQRLADTAFAAAEDEHAAATVAFDSAREANRVAARYLAATRDRVALLGPPTPVTGGLAAHWQQLTAWCDGQTAALGTERAAAEDDHTSRNAQREGVEQATRALCATVLEVDTSDVELRLLGERLVVAETEAKGELQWFNERRTQLVALKTRIHGLHDAAEVADTLGGLLRADGFERWLMSSALEGLVDTASTSLRELSSGQFSLVIQDGSFAVRDHANADEVRRARTLSGGETFLASLALALALADAIAELAPEGAPRIESIFLDEGFGTLDPQTLETVATAIEELGAGGRMVGIVTHIRELADRMPVRLEVTKTANTSTVARVEA